MIRPLAKVQYSIATIALSMLALLCVGVMTIYSATSETSGQRIVFMQLIWISIGSVAALFPFFCPLEKQVRYAHFALAFIGVLLFWLFFAAVIHKISPEWAAKIPFVPGQKKGGFRWLGLGKISPDGTPHAQGLLASITVQPSEFAKTILLLFLGGYYGTRAYDAIKSSWKHLFIPGMASVAILFLILAGKDLSTTVITAVMVISMFWLGGVHLKRILLVVLVLAAAGSVMLFTSPERISRITSFRHPETVQSDDGYQLYRSLVALGNGGLIGQGQGKSIMKTGYLPEKHTDFILAIWGEENGYLGMIFVVLCYLCLLGGIACIASLSRDRVGSLICLGAGILIATQALVNIGVISGAGPTTGVTAPFISYGGSSIISLLLIMGMVFNVCRTTYNDIRYEQQYGERLPSMQELNDTLHAV